MIDNLFSFFVGLVAGPLILVLVNKVNSHSESENSPVYSRKRKCLHYSAYSEKNNNEQLNNETESENNDETDDELPPLEEVTPNNESPETFEEFVEKYEKENNSKLIIINHSKTNTSSFPFSGPPTLCSNDALKVIDILRETPNEMPLDIILHTHGGSMAAAEIIVKALLNRAGPVRVHVPYYAESAGTLIALAGNEIYLGQYGWFTQVDPQLGYISTTTLLEYTDPVSFSKGSWVGELACIGRIGATKAMKRCTELLGMIEQSRGYASAETIQLYDTFVRGKSNHDRPLTVDLLQCVKGLHHEIKPEIMELFKKYNDERS